MTKKISKVTLDVFGEEYEISCGGGGGGDITPGTPIPRDTVDSAAIIDGSVQQADLSQGLKDSMMTQADRVTQADLDGFRV